MQAQIFCVWARYRSHDMTTGPLLVVPDDPRSLAALCKGLGSAYALEFSRSISEAHAAHEHRPGLILLDIEQPDFDALAVCRTLQADPATTDIPAVVFTTCKAPGCRVAAFRAGAVDYITKPAALQDVRARVRLQRSLTQRSGADISNRDAVISMLGNSSRSSGPEGRLHPWRMPVGLAGSRPPCTGS
jgi:CheY-like chemotaxis protein